MEPSNSETQPDKKPNIVTTILILPPELESSPTPSPWWSSLASSTPTHPPDPTPPSPEPLPIWEGGEPDTWPYIPRTPPPQLPGNGEGNDKGDEGAGKGKGKEKCRKGSGKEGQQQGNKDIEGKKVEKQDGTSTRSQGMNKKWDDLIKSGWPTRD